MAVITSKKLAEVQDQLEDLGWETQRMSSSGVESYNKLCRIFNVQEAEL